MTSESDEAFLDEMEAWVIGSLVFKKEHRARLFALARRGAAVQMAEDDQFARIQKLEAENDDLRIEITRLNFEVERLTRTNQAKREHRDKLLEATSKQAAEIERLRTEVKVWQGHAKTAVWSDNPQTLVLEVGSDDAVKVWLNGQLVHSNLVSRPVSPAQDTVEVTLKQGWNELMLKVIQSSGYWGFCAGFAAPDGGKVEGLRFRAQ